MDVCNHVGLGSLFDSARKRATCEYVSEKMGYEYYLPMSCSTRRWSDRWKKVETPLSLVISFAV